MIILLAAILTYLLLQLILPFLRNNFADKPNHRSSHKSIVPSGGGIGFVIVGIFGMVLQGNYSGLLCLPLAIVGFWDDKVSLNPLFRYLIHLFTALLLFFFSTAGIHIYQNSNLLVLVPIFLFYLLSATAIINFINFMDGLDGLVGSCMAVIIAFFCITVDISFLPLLGAILGFLVMNYPPARIFMGDIGSTFLGAIYVLMLLNTDSFEKSFALLLIGSPLLLDSSICVIRRYLDGQKVFEAHSLHLFQRLHRAGWSHLKVSSLYIGVTILISLSFIIFGLVPAAIMVLATIYLGSCIDKKYAIPFKK